jgi:uncharacterized membrane protein
VSDEPRRGAGRWWRPLDLVLAGVLAVLAVVTVQWPTAVPPAARVATAGSLCVFLVGYTVLEMLFPQPAVRDDGTAVFLPVERVVLALALSVVIVPLVALSVDYAPFSLRIESIVSAVGALTLVAAIAAWVRRRRRGIAPTGGGLGDVVADGVAAWRSASTLDRVLDVVVVFALIFATVAVASVPLHDPARQPYTELTLLTVNETGAFVADEYPRTMTRNQSYRTCLVVGNHERQSVQYTIRVTQERTGARTSAESSAVRTVNQTNLGLTAGETRVLGFVIRPPDNWDRLTVRYRLYTESHPPGEAEAPYREVSIPVTVAEPDGDPGPTGPDGNGTCRRPSSTAS